MKFVVSTKPLSDGLNLGIVNANVSKYYQKSTIAQITAENDVLRINLEAASILSEIKLKGKADVEGKFTIFVDCLMLKQLISTIDTPTVTFEFSDNGLIIHSNKSKFTLPKMVDDDIDVDLASPSNDYNEENLVEIKKLDWKFVKDFQMYALSMSLIYPVYTKVYIGEKGEVLVGDLDNGIFTHSVKNNLGKTCLLTDTVINLFNSLPEDSKLVDLGNSYLVKVSTDSYEFISEFTPLYEDTDGMGNYSVDTILQLITPDSANSISNVEVDINAINKVLNQSALLSSSSEDIITLEINNNELHLFDNNVDCEIPIKGDSKDNYSVVFKTNLLKSVISNSPEDKVYISPMIRDDNAIGIRFKYKDLTIVLSGVEQ